MALQIGSTCCQQKRGALIDGRICSEGLLDRLDAAARHLAKRVARTSPP
jgi:hypothetical protein